MKPWYIITVVSHTFRGCDVTKFCAISWEIGSKIGSISVPPKSDRFHCRTDILGLHLGPQKPFNVSHLSPLRNCSKEFDHQGKWTVILYQEKRLKWIFDLAVDKIQGQLRQNGIFSSIIRSINRKSTGPKINRIKTLPDRNPDGLGLILVNFDFDCENILMDLKFSNFNRLTIEIGLQIP